MTMKLIAIESPFNGTLEERARNMRYLAWCIKHVYACGYAAYAGHGLGPCAYPEDPAHRAHGLAANVAFAAACDDSWFFIDLEWSGGMLEALKAVQSTGRSWAEVRLRRREWKAFERGEWPPGSTMRWVPAEIMP